ncbi:MAG: FAD-dependent 5-carboxymethylaminomethyl-2-thiouridine(34) oxidoreductase MnmC [Burkholderiaceae bacterium]|nr:FAD-dependent 5-carboxymethylaminomethyl-2-thiouridine(34) oxidoreductase MnmC [Burkholderiaceae bacterium]
MDPIEPHPPIVFDESGAPVSVRYGDVFRSRGGARAEARAVFVEGCGLPQRWRALHRPGSGVARPFAVLELGFGAGLNFLETLAAWRDAAPAGLRLHFVSIEAHPLARTDLARVHEALGADVADAARLRARWPLALPGMHPIEFDDGKVVLHLCLGDASRMAARLRMAADAIFLDGFAPERNPAMWDEATMRAIARLARPGAPFSTWTAASHVRDALVAAGFEVERIAGHGGKRHRLRGRYAPRWRSFPAPSAPPEWPSNDVLVVGAGLAGAATAAGFARRGWKVQVVEAQPLAAAGGSGQPLAADHLHLSSDDNVLARLTRAGLSARDWLADDATPAPDGKLVLDADDEQSQKRIAMLKALRFPAEFVRHVDGTEASELAGIMLPRGALWLPRAHVEDPRALVRRWLACDAIALRTGTRVERLEPDDRGWRALGAGGGTIARAAIVVLANAADATRLGATSSIRMRAMHGQSTWLARECLPGLRRAVSGLAWAAPAEDRILVGATFEAGDCVEFTAQADASNLRRLARMLAAPPTGALARADDWARAARSASVGVRWSSADRIASIGAMPDEANAGIDAERLVHDARRPLPRMPGMYGAFGFGARGVLWACLAARCLPALADGSPAPIEADLLRAIDPARFLRRNLRQGRER